MGKQINFYRNREIEQEKLEECSRLGLSRFDRDSGPFFAYVDPTDNWSEADAILSIIRAMVVINLKEEFGPAQ